MTERQALLAAILANPGDDVARLVFADWLEENGEQERAEFIRAEIALAKMPKRYCKQATQNSYGYWSCDNCEFCRVHIICEDFHRKPEHWTNFKFECAHTSRPMMYMHTEPSLLISTRGFVSRILCPFDVWIEHGPALVREHPISSVIVNDKSPTGIPDESWLLIFEPGDFVLSYMLPDEIYSRLKRPQWEAYNEAMNDLSEALISWAKEQQ